MHIQVNFTTSGTLGSGQVGWPHLASGAVRSGHIGNAAVLSGSVGSGQIASGHLASGFIANLAATLTSGAIGSGLVASGSVQGFFGATRHIASGTVGVSDFGSGAVVAGTVGSGAVQSGNVGSGQIGQFHIASGAITSGRLGTTGTPNGTLFLRDDFSWASAGGGLSSGNVGSGYVASGAVQGFFGTTRQIASGTIGVFDFGSGAVVAGTIGSGAIVSGNIASGQIGTNHLANNSVTSGDIASGQVGQFHMASGAITSGTLAVAGLPDNGKFLRFDFTWGTPTDIIIGSGTITSGMLANNSVVSGSIASGQVGWPHIASGAIRSGQLAVAGTPDGTKFLRDDFTWALTGSGTSVIASGDVGSGKIASGAVQGELGTTRHIVSGTVGSRDLGSGVVATFAHNVALFYSGLNQTIQAAETISGVRAINIDPNGNARIAMASLSGRMPAVGVLNFNVVSGELVNLLSIGYVRFLSGQQDYSGFTGQQLFVGRSGHVCPTSGSYNSGGLASGDTTQPVGVVRDASGGAVIQVAALPAFVAGLVTSGDIASGQVGWVHIADAGVRSGNIGSGQIGRFHLTSGSVGSGTLAVGGTPDGTLFLRDDFTWQAAGGAVGSGAIGSGKIASGTVQGFFGTTRHIASGTIGVFDFGSGAVVAGTVGSGAIVSGNIASGQIGAGHLADGAVQSGDIASGQVGKPHIASGAVASGQLATTGTPNGTLFLRDDFSWAAAGGGLSSGAVGSGYVASGAVQGFFGTTRHIASGTIGVFDFGSGAVVSGTVGSGAIATINIGSGVVQGKYASITHIASGTVGGQDFASGANIHAARTSQVIWSGFPMNLATVEAISGIRAVYVTQSGYLGIAMASVSGRMPAVGIMTTNVASGATANHVHAFGAFQLLDLASGVVDFSGYVGRHLYVGRSGQIVTGSGHFNSGGLLSGDTWQPIGTAANSGGAVIGVMPQLAFVPGLITSGNIDSGQVDTNHLASGAYITYAKDVQETSWVTVDTVSGGNAAWISSGNFAGLAMAGSGLRLPAVGVFRTNAVSGAAAQVILNGLFMTANCANWSGQQGKPLYVGSGGMIVAQAVLVSGQGWQRIGVAVSGGIVVANSLTITSGGMSTPPGTF